VLEKEHFYFWKELMETNIENGEDGFWITITKMAGIGHFRRKLGCLAGNDFLVNGTAGLLCSGDWRLSVSFCMNAAVLPRFRVLLFGAKCASEQSASLTFALLSTGFACYHHAEV
jgi:hypothetical protein